VSTLAYVKVPTDIVLTHEDAGEWVILQCFGAMQPELGHFANRAVMDTVLGRPRARRCVDRGDVQALPDGRWAITDWDFQEGDRTVADRMKRWRQRRKDRQGVQRLFPDGVAHRNRDTVGTVTRDTAR
jgi:hypothetical protein